MLFYLAFSDKGFALAQKLAKAMGGTPSRSGQPLCMKDWVQQHFAAGNALVFVGAVGIAVRAVAPHLKSKATDPAVVAVDECGRFAVPLVSGHLGGANDLARRIEKACGAVAVVTTATDVNGVFAVDEWAKRQNCTVLDIKKIKDVSSAVLAGKEVGVYSEFPVAGQPPKGVVLSDEQNCDVYLGIHDVQTNALRLVPKTVVLGVGCRRGTSCEAFEQAFALLIGETKIFEQAVCRVASIDLKANEPGLVEFCRAHNWEFVTYTADQLREVQGSFSASAFVKQITGVDNVCERSAILAGGGALIHPKTAGNGITMAMALNGCQPDWRWKDE